MMPEMNSMVCFINKDSELDDQDQEFVDQLAIPTSDAVLCCPGCFCVLSRDCQR